MTATWTTPKTWTAGETVLAHEWNTYVRDNLDWLRRRPGVALVIDATQEIGDSDWLTVDLKDSAASSLWENGDLWDESGGQITLPESGLWLVSARATFAANATGNTRGLRVQVDDGTTTARLPNILLQPPVTTASIATTLSGGMARVWDTGTRLKLQVFQDSGAELNLTSCLFQVRLLAGLGTTPTWTAPRTWSNSDVVTAAMLNAELRDNFAWLWGPPATYVYSDADTSVTTATWTTVTFDTLGFANASMWSSSVNPTRVTPGAAGRYLIVVNTRFDADSTNERGLRLRCNGSATQLVPLNIGRTKGGSTARAWLWGAQELPLGATDYVELQLWQNSGSTLNGVQSRLYIVQVGR